MDESVEILDGIGVQVVDNVEGVLGCYQFILLY